MKCHLYTSLSLDLNPVQVIAISQDILLLLASLDRETVLFASLGHLQIKLGEVYSHLAALGDVKLPYLILVWVICVTARFVVDVVSGDKIKIHCRYLGDFWAWGPL